MVAKNFCKCDGFAAATAAEKAQITKQQCTTCSQRSRLLMWPCKAMVPNKAAQAQTNGSAAHVAQCRRNSSDCLCSMKPFGRCKLPTAIQTSHDLCMMQGACCRQRGGVRAATDHTGVKEPPTPMPRQRSQQEQPSPWVLCRFLPKLLTDPLSLDTWAHGKHALTRLGQHVTRNAAHHFTAHVVKFLRTSLIAS